MHIARGAFVIQDIKAGTRQGQSPRIHLRREGDRLLVGFKRGFEAIELAEFACEAKMNERILGVNRCNASKLFNRLVPVSGADQQAPLGPSHIQGCGLPAKHGVVGLKGLLGSASGRQDVAAELVKRHRIGIRLDALIERFKCRRDRAALPIRLCAIDNLPV